MQPKRDRARLPRSVWMLGLVSLFMDSSSELIHALLPLFLVSVLGVGALELGLVEGIAEATASFGKLASGALSDAFARRKPLVLLGYGLAAATKPLFPLADSVGTVLLARFLDRVGKGIRGAPRDALIADVTPVGLRGRAFGLRQALDTVGAVAGPLAAFALLGLFAEDIRAVLWFAVLPAVVAVAVLAFGVEERPRPRSPVGGFRLPLQRTDLARLPAAFWMVLGVGSLGTLARFGEAFLLLRLADLGLAAASVPLGLVAMNLVYTAAAFPFGILADRHDRRRLLASAFLLLVLADLLLAMAATPVAAFLGIALFGLHLAASQGLLAAVVADAAPEDLRGTAFGLWHLATGVALLMASLIAGFLWDVGGAPAAFSASAVLAALASLAFPRLPIPSRLG
ncbi:Inner membrane transport protein YajR [bacterium HR40]|nr:Inner membrane transport protein YajR [bacterium HR40]